MNRLLVLGLLLSAPLAWAQPVMAPLDEENVQDVADADRVENWSGKTVLIFAPHPDDETFSMGGTIARLTDQGNKVVVVVFTNDDKGSKDVEMTSERLARIRRAEEEEACRIVGVPLENVHWLGYEDGNLEYADPQRLRGEVARFIKLYRPDAVFCPDPGSDWVQWHKTDHRMSANITQDAFIAAEWHLYYPQHLLDEGLEAYSVPVAYYYYSQKPNYEVDITEQFDRKIQASAAHVSQFEPSNSKYTPDMPESTRQQIRDGFARYHEKDGGYVERFRRKEMP
jgi:LmbE family N-acetylglucosaminyl deacetylase